MQIEERVLIQAPVEKVWEFLLDAQSIGGCVPGCEDVESFGDHSYAAHMRVKVGPISANFKIQIDITEMEPPRMLKSTMKGKDSKIASSLNAMNVLALTGIGSDQTELHYRTEVSVFGRLGKFGEGVMKRKAKEVGEQFATALKARLELLSGPWSPDVAGE